MDRKHLLAAELFSYSFANYENHLCIGHVRFEQLMPDNAETMEMAFRQGWPDERIAEAFEINLTDAPDAATAFRNGIRFSIQDAVAEGLEGEDAIERLVGNENFYKTSIYKCLAK